MDLPPEIRLRIYDILFFGSEDDERVLDRSSIALCLQGPMWDLADIHLLKDPSPYQRMVFASRYHIHPYLPFFKFF